MSDDQKPRRVEVLALWEMRSGKGWKGQTKDGRKVVAWRNDRKKNPREPDIRVYEDDQERQPPPSDDSW